MLKRIITGTAVFLIVAVLIVAAFPLTNEWVSAAEGALAETSEATNDSGYTLGRGFGRGRRHMMHKAEDLDGDGQPDLPEGFICPFDADGDGVPDLPDGATPRWNRGRVRDPEPDGEAFGRAFGMGKRHMIHKAEDLDGDGYPDLPEGFVCPFDTDGDGVPDLPDGVRPPWKKGLLNDLEDAAERPFCGRGHQGVAARETP